MRNFKARYRSMPFNRQRAIAARRPRAFVHHSFVAPWIVYREPEKARPIVRVKREHSGGFAYPSRTASTATVSYGSIIVTSTSSNVTGW